MNTLRTAVADYLALRRALGYKLHRLEQLLQHFVAFLEAHETDYITTKLALEWARCPPTSPPTAWGSQRLAAVRLFAQYRYVEDPRTEIPPAHLFAQRPRRATPYIYSEEEIRRLLDACHRLRSKGLRHHTYYAFFGLLTVTGCRLSELLTLHRDDVRIQERLLIIRDAKFGKSRLIPLHPSTCQQLDTYQQLREQYHPTPKTDRFFLSDQGTPLTPWSARHAFIRLSEAIGLRKPTDSHGPRIHDLRHTFAVKTILQWYQNGRDVNQKMPFLSAYLGHKKPSDTYWYLTGTPQLLAVAATRLEEHLGG